MKRGTAEPETRLSYYRPRNDHLPTPTTFVVEYYSYEQRLDELKKRKLSTGKLYNEEQLSLLIARMFYNSGLPFRLARNRYFIDVIQPSTVQHLRGSKPPSSNMLRTSLLQRERANVHNLMEPIRGMWREKGVTIVVDGWKDSKRRSLINFTALTSHGPMLLKTVDCTGKVQDKYFIANKLKDVINEVGPRDVVQVITNNAANFTAAGKLIEKQFPHIKWTLCIRHVLNLALEDIFAAKNPKSNGVLFEECRWISGIIRDLLVIKSFIVSHPMRFAMYIEFEDLKLLSTVGTHFASTFVMLKTFRHIKNTIRSLTLCGKWSCYQGHDMKKACFLNDKVMDDHWWDQVDYIFAFTDPIYNRIRSFDSDKRCIYSICLDWDYMVERVKSAIFKHEHKKPEEKSSLFDAVHTILVERWNINKTPLHCLAHSLDPRYYNAQWRQENPRWVNPHYDIELAYKTMKCMEQYFEGGFTEQSKVNSELVKFIGLEDEYADAECRNFMGELDDPIDWWLVYGANTPVLQRVALKILGQPSSSCCSERYPRTYSLIHSMDRKRMTSQIADDLVFIHINLRLLAREHL